MREKAFFNWRLGGIHLNFPNGNTLSTIWGGGSYSENHDDFGSITNPKAIGSNNVEIMFDCPEELQKKIEKKYNDGDEQPIGYLNIVQWSEIVNLLSKPSKRS